MPELTNEQLLLEAVGLIDRLAARLGSSIYIGNGKPGHTVSDRFYLVRVDGYAVANPDPVTALYAAMERQEAA